MEVDTHERDSDVGDSPTSHNGDISEGEAEDSCDEMRPHNMIADHNDVLAKLKMQVRDIKDDFDSRQMHFPLPNRTTSQEFPLGMAAFPFQHPGSFLPPLAPQQVTPSSASSHSSEGSVSSQQTWSFEEQFKQVRQLYEINDDPKRKEFLDDLFSFMQKRGTPINRLPIMAKSVLDLYELYNLVIARGGLVDVINKKLWQEIIKGLHLPSSITSAAFTLRTQYMKYLYPYECAKRHLSTPSELQAAIDGNRREGRRSSYGQYDQRSPGGPPGPAISPHQLASHQQLAARINSVMSGAAGLQNGFLHPSHQSPLGTPLNGCPVPGLSTGELEARMLEYMKLINKEMRNNGLAGTLQDNSSLPVELTPNLSQIDLSRLTLWNIYNNNQLHHEPQKEALNLNLSETHIPSPHSIKREPDSELSPPTKKTRDEEQSKNSPPSSAHFKIDSRGDSRNGDNSMVVSMEFNGITYQGVLFPQTSTNGRPGIAS